MSPIIPIIDLTNDTPTQQASAIRDALGSVGFFEVRNSGLSPDDIATMFEQSQHVFALPMEEKEKYPADKLGTGYIKPRAQALGLGRRDYRETFQYGREASHREQALPKPWQGNPEATDQLKAFHKAVHDVSERLLELFALALDLPFEHFRRAHSFGLNTGISLIHYPPLDGEREDVEKMDIRAGEHKDWGTLTMPPATRFNTTSMTPIMSTARLASLTSRSPVFQQPQGQPGLQVFLPLSALPSNTQPTDLVNNSEYPTSGQWGWFDAPVPPPGGFLVNVGLAMELWSGGVYKATLHRVIFPKTPDGEEVRDRYTFAYFVQPDDDVVIQPVVNGGIDTTAPSVSAKDLFGGKLKESMERINKLASGSVSAVIESARQEITA